MWTIGWALLGALLGVFQSYFGGSYAIIDPPVWAGPFWTVILLFTIRWAIAGALSGALFAIVLAIAERNRSVAHLRLGRVAMWGIIGSLLIPGPLILVALVKWGIYSWFPIAYLAITAIAGGLSAASTLLLARGSASQRGSLTSA